MNATIKVCFLCGGDLYPHCPANPQAEWYSPTCDLVYCERCRNVGSLDGRWWPEATRRNSVRFREILKTLAKLRSDLDSRDQQR